MGAAVLKQRLVSEWGGPWEWQARPEPETISTGIPEIDAATGGGLPRGCLTEIIGPASSGRASLLASILAQATARQEACALVDAEDQFDPTSAAAAGVELARLLWVRCEHNAEHALKAADLLIQGGGFGMIALDFGDTPAQTVRYVPLQVWFRFRRAVESTPTILVVLEQESNAKTCASLVLHLGMREARWSHAVESPGKILLSHAPGTLFEGSQLYAEMIRSRAKREGNQLLQQGGIFSMRMDDAGADFEIEPAEIRLRAPATSRDLQGGPGRR